MINYFTPSPTYDSILTDRPKDTPVELDCYAASVEHSRRKESTESVAPNDCMFEESSRPESHDRSSFSRSESQPSDRSPGGPVILVFGSGHYANHYVRCVTYSQDKEGPQPQRGGLTQLLSEECVRNALSGTGLAPTSPPVRSPKLRLVPKPLILCSLHTPAAPVNYPKYERLYKTDQSACISLAEQSVIASTQRDDRRELHKSVAV
ncbi:hypothetical protein BJ546DRAFT_954509 [Cryomyces antarcticus]